MITLISALNLTAKIGISIAVFVVLIAVEVLALVMLVKWKKNYKQALIKKAKEESAGFAKSAQDVISYAMFGTIAQTFLQERNANALNPEPLESYEEKCDDKLIFFFEKIQ